MDQTLTGNWVNTANPWADNEVINTLTIDGGIVTWTDLTTYPTGCSAGQFVSTVGDTLTCGTPATGASSNSLNFDEFQNPLVLDTNITTTSASFNWDFGGTNFANIGSASFTRGFKIANPTGDNLFRITSAGTVNAGLWQGTAVTDTYVNDAISIIGGTIGANSISGLQTTTGTLTFGDNGDNIVFDSNTWDITGAGVGSGFTQFTVDNLDLNGNSFTSITGGITIAPNSALTNFTGSASISANFEVIGYASASFFQGSAFGAIDCNDNAEGLQWSTATNTFTCRAWADADIPDTLTITNLSGTNTGDVTLAGTPDYITISGQTITRAKLDVSDDTNLTAGTDLTLTTNDLTLDSTLTQAYSFSNTGSQSMTGSLNISKGLVANKYSGGGLSDCFALTKVLRFALGGGFSCGTLVDGDIPDTISLIGGTIGANSISGTQTTTSTLTFGDNGDNIVFDSNNWDISSAGVFSGLTGLTSTGTVDFSGATLFKIVSAANPTINAAGLIAMHTGSSSLDWYNGTNQIVERPKKCVVAFVESPTAANNKWMEVGGFDDPFTLSEVYLVNASGSNSAGWNLYYGTPANIRTGTSTATKVFPTDRNASASAQIKYTDLTNTTILDGQILNVVISSASATLEKFSIKYCGRYNH